MTFHFLTVVCCNCDKILASHVTTDLVDAQFFCPNCIVHIDELRYTLGIIHMQDLAKSLMNLHFHNFTSPDKINNTSLLLKIKHQSYGYWHARIWMRVKQLCERLNL